MVSSPMGMMTHQRVISSASHDVRQHHTDNCTQHLKCCYSTSFLQDLLGEEQAHQTNFDTNYIS